MCNENLAYFLEFFWQKCKAFNWSEVNYLNTNEFIWGMHILFVDGSVYTWSEVSYLNTNEFI